MLDPHGSLFIGGDHKRVDVGTSKADDLVASPIQLVVDINRKPAGHSPGPLSNIWRVLACACLEHQRVQSAYRSGQRPDLACDTIDEEIDCFGGKRIIGVD